MILPKNPSPDVGKLAKELRSGHRAALARAITLIESRRGDHQAAARDLVQALLPDTGQAVRVGITGSPGVGKSTTIDALAKAGAEAIYPPGTVIADAAEELIHKLNARLGHSEAAE